MAGGQQSSYYASLTFRLYNLNLRLIATLRYPHSMQQAARFSDYTAFMYLGELLEFNHTETVFARPSNKMTEDYISGRTG